MRKHRKFTPGAVDALEERMVLSHGGVGAGLWHGHAAAWVVPTLSQRTFERGLENIDRAFQSYARDYRNAFLASVNQSRFIGDAAATSRLNDFAAWRTGRLANQLSVAPRGVPYGLIDMGQGLREIGVLTGAALTGARSLQEAGTAGQTVIFPAQNFAREFYITTIQDNLAAGRYRFR